MGAIATKTFAALVALTIISAPAMAAPVTWQFGGSGGNLGPDEVFTSGTSSLTAYAINTESPPAPRLNQTTAGLGVKLRGHHNGGGQIDNRGDDEAIVFDFGSLYSVSSIRISVANFLGFPVDEFEIYGSNNASVIACTTGGLACLTSISTSLVSGIGDGTYIISGIFRYIIATVPGTNSFFPDDYRVRSLTAVSAVPLPASLPLFGTGLVALGFAAHRRRRRKVAPG